MREIPVRKLPTPWGGQGESPEHVANDGQPAPPTSCIDRFFRCAANAMENRPLSLNVLHYSKERVEMMLADHVDPQMPAWASSGQR